MLGGWALASFLSHKKEEEEECAVGEVPEGKNRWVKSPELFVDLWSYCKQRWHHPDHLSAIYVAASWPDIAPVLWPGGVAVICLAEVMTGLYGCNTNSYVLTNPTGASPSSPAACRCLWFQKRLTFKRSFTDLFVSYFIDFISNNSGQRGCSAADRLLPAGAEAAQSTAHQHRWPGLRIKRIK